MHVKKLDGASSERIIGRGGCSEDETDFVVRDEKPFPRLPLREGAVGHVGQKGVLRSGNYVFAPHIALRDFRCVFHACEAAVKCYGE